MGAMMGAGGGAVPTGCGGERAWEGSEDVGTGGRSVYSTDQLDRGVMGS